ncbi:MAG: bile acid:sodium symporter [Prevotella sp.]|uniref:bile acid:sodium symporter n=1 Tax=Prevotella sp. TaxID=59823 RepID=UPI002A314F0F|nr:bile acid:sodium symporter [Prevotella sp.]MDD7317610.1 bile acid:sodium symporter [Prevotellaceae bacterium]MDY4020543.1 bile acid:sodium symporter [Prevotella sp.]
MIKFLKDWTLPVAIVLGTLCYLPFCYIPALDGAARVFGPVFDVIFPFFVFLTLLVTFCKVDFHQMRPHRWHLWVLVAQVVLVVLNIAIILFADNGSEQKILWEAVLTCVIGPSASAAPVVTGKLGGNISTMTTFTIISSLASAFMIPAVFPLLEQDAGITFLAAFIIILEKVAMVLILPLILGYLIRHYVGPMHRWIVSKPNLGFYFWGVSLSITTGITVKNIIHSDASLPLLIMIALFSLIVCFVQFGIGRAIGNRFGEKINSGQALFQKNTALSIWVAYMYLNPVASVGAGCYVLWQNIINSLELWEYRNGKLK